MERLRTIFAPSRCLSKCNRPLSFRSLDQKRNQRKLGRFEHKRVIIGPTFWPFLRANPHHQLMRVYAVTRPPQMFEPRIFNQRKRQVGHRTNPTKTKFSSLVNLQVGFWISKRNTIRKTNKHAKHTRISTQQLSPACMHYSLGNTRHSFVTGLRNTPALVFTST